MTIMITNRHINQGVGNTHSGDFQAVRSFAMESNSDDVEVVPTSEWGSKVLLLTVLSVVDDLLITVQRPGD